MRIATALTLVLLSLPSWAWAQIPRTLSYQGSLTGPGGVPHPDGTYSFTFRLYESASGGAPLWTETKSLATVRGVFSTVLGDVSALGPGIAFDRPYWLGIQLGSDPEFGPRIPLTASGYSLTAAKVSLPFAASQSSSSALISVINTATATGIGVTGQSNASDGVGVRGIAAAPTGVNYGVYGSSASLSGYAGYFFGRGRFTGDLDVLDDLAVGDALSVGGSQSVGGNLSVSGTLSHTPVTRYAWVVPSEFNYASVMQFTSDRLAGTYAATTYQPVAPVSLPHGATITEVRSFIQDNSTTEDMLVRLYRVSPLVGVETVMADVSSTGSNAATREFFDTTVSNPIVDTATYNYVAFVSFETPSSVWDLVLRAVRITYTVAGP